MKALVLTAISFLSLFSTSVSAEETYAQPEAPLVAEVLGTQIRTSNGEEMQYLIVKKLLDQYAADNDIEVQQEEIDAFVEAVRRAAEKDRKARKARRDQLASELESNALTDVQRQASVSELEMLNSLLDDASGTESGSGEDSPEDKATREQIAAAFILQWKINRALYQQYGGRIIFQQGGPEPLDAYRQFLEEKEKQGAFSILEKSFEPAFWRYYRTDSIHSFYPAGSKEESQAFATPWWMMEPVEDVQ